MKIAIKYPRKKHIEAASVNDLKQELKVLMIEQFDIKNSKIKPFVDVKLNVISEKTSDSDFNLLLKKNAVIVPTIITQCKI